MFLGNLRWKFDARFFSGNFSWKFSVETRSENFSRPFSWLSGKCQRCRGVLWWLFWIEGIRFLVKGGVGLTITNQDPTTLPPKVGGGGSIESWVTQKWGPKMSKAPGGLVGTLLNMGGQGSVSARWAPNPWLVGGGVLGGPNTGVQKCRKIRRRGVSDFKGTPSLRFWIPGAPCLRPRIRWGTSWGTHVSENIQSAGATPPLGGPRSALLATATQVTFAWWPSRQCIWSPAREATLVAHGHQIAFVCTQRFDAQNIMWKTLPEDIYVPEDLHNTNNTQYRHNTWRHIYQTYIYHLGCPCGQIATPTHSPHPIWFQARAPNPSQITNREGKK